jgi:hypothetical protein
MAFPPDWSTPCESPATPSQTADCSIPTRFRTIMTELLNEQEKASKINNTTYTADLTTSIVGHFAARPSSPSASLGRQDRMHDHRIRYGLMRRRATPPPGPVGTRGDRAVLFAQHPTSRLDRVGLGTHVVNERHDQRLRESSSPANTPR